MFQQASNPKDKAKVILGWPKIKKCMPDNGSGAISSCDQALNDPIFFTHLLAC